MLALGVSLEIVPVNLLIHAGIFVLVLAVMSRFLVRPISRVLAERDNAITQRRLRADIMTLEADQLERTYQERIAAAQLDAVECREILRREGFAEAAKVMEHARAKSTQQLDAAKQELQQLADEAKTLLQANAHQFGRFIAERILERSVAAHEEMVRGNPADESVTRKAN